VKTQVCVEQRVRNFLHTLAPAPRRAVWQAIKALERDAGDIKLLEGKLSGWSRLRVTGYRVLFQENAAGGIRKISCVFAERRGVVYEMFAELLAGELME
jgi:mRNA-degrading endonuclease RelE of RelBE toxin-antitoxin system